jgi:ABC-type Mn2+/Zn2+ transport system permease subunit
MRLEDAVGVGFAFVAEEHVFTYLLSSPFTARNLVKERGDTQKVKEDLEISVVLSVLLSLALAYAFRSEATAVAGILFGLLLYAIYAQRGELW